MSIHLTKNYVKTETYHAKSQESSYAATSYFLSTVIWFSIFLLYYICLSHHHLKFITVYYNK